ncbi:10285_t:CDS:2, partial [Racocetra persica]
FMIAPWLYDLLTNEQYDELYYITPEIKTEHERELSLYLTSILEDLIAKKKKLVDPIDLAIKNQKGCNEKLDILATLQTESASEIHDIAPKPKTLIIKPHTYTHEKKSLFSEHVSIMQRSEPEYG